MAPLPAWSMPAGEVLEAHGVTLERGLSAEQVAEKRSRYGWNELPAPEATPLWKLIAEQFQDTLVKVGCRHLSATGAAATVRSCPAAARLHCEPALWDTCLEQSSRPGTLGDRCPHRCVPCDRP